MASKIRKFTGKSWFIAIISTFLVYLVSGFLIGRYTDDPRPWVDAIAFSISLTAGIISFLRYNNQYYWWLASGLAQMVLWYISFTHGSASLAMFVNSSVYLLNDVLAFTVSPWYNQKNVNVCKNGRRILQRTTTRIKTERGTKVKNTFVSRSKHV